MYRLIAFLITSFLLISCSSKTTKTQIIPTDSIKTKDITSTEILAQPFNIALVVPLNTQGDNKGISLVQAAQMAVEDAANSNVNLTVLDSSLIGSSPDSLLKELSSQQVIIGPLYGPDTEKLANILPNIPILSLSNDSSLKGNNLLIMGISPNSQAATVINYAIGQGVNSFHLLLPENKFGHLVNGAVEEILSERNGMSYSANWYEPGNSEEAITTLVGSLDHNASSQAVFMPQGDYKNLEFLNKALEGKNTKIKLIGLQGWDHEEIKNLSNLNGAIFLKKNIPSQSFNHKYHNLFGSHAGNLEFITYNTILMVVNMHKADLMLNKDNIIANNKNIGTFSEVKFNSQGVSFYNLEIAKVNDNNFTNLP